MEQLERELLTALGRTYGVTYGAMYGTLAS